MARNPRLPAFRRTLVTRRTGWAMVAVLAILGILLGAQQLAWAADLAGQAAAEATRLVLEAGWLLLLLIAFGLALGLILSGPRGRAAGHRLLPRLTTRPVRWGAAAAGLLVVLLVLVVIVLPPVLAGKDRTVQNDVRTTLLQGLGALLVLTGASIGAAVTLRQIRVSQAQLQATREQMQHTLETTRQQLNLTEQGQITDRFTKAVDQLGSQHLDIRLGGIYALERIARDSPPDRATIEEVLTAFVRGHAPWPPPPAPPSLQAITQRLVEFGRRQRSTLRRWAASKPTRRSQYVLQQILGPVRRPDGEESRPPCPAADVQAAMTVLARRTVPPEVHLAGQELPGQRLDLNQVNLQGAWLDGANLRGVMLVRANLQDATLIEAELPDAWLQSANFQGADLRGANLQDALLNDANLQDARLYGANLRLALLNDANLRGADLRTPSWTCLLSPTPISTVRGQTRTRAGRIAGIGPRLRHAASTTDTRTNRR